MTDRLQSLIDHQTRLRDCRRCAGMQPPVVVGMPALSPIIQIGQAPGVHEGRAGKPFAWTAGKTLFGWYRQIGVDETALRERVYLAAVCRCFPGKNARGGDRVPGAGEVQNCATWLADEITLLRPQLLIPVGRLAIAQFLTFARLTEVVGRCHAIAVQELEIDVLPLPHPSGVSTWHRVEPGKSLLRDALRLLAAHPVWQAQFTARE